ncbi:MAG: hypothetical protein ACK5SE_14875 [Pseudanabaena sp.]|jgi:hypothetical protein
MILAIALIATVSVLINYLFLVNTPTGKDTEAGSAMFHTLFLIVVSTIAWWYISIAMGIVWLCCSFLILFAYIIYYTRK